MRRSRLLLSLVCVLFAIGAAAEDPPPLSIGTPVITVGQTVTFTVTPANGTLKLNPFDKTILKVDPDQRTITGLKGGSVELTGTLNGVATNALKVKVEPIQLKIAALAKPLIEGEERPIAVEATSALGAVQNVKLVSADEQIVTVANGVVKGVSKARGDSRTQIKATVNDVPIGAVEVTVREAIASVEAPAFEIVEGTTIDLPVKLIGKHGSTFTASERPLESAVDTAQLITVDQAGRAIAKMLDGNIEKETKLTLVSAEGEGRKPMPKEVAAKVRLQAATIVVDDRPILPRGGKLVIKPDMRDRLGNQLDIANIEWSLANKADEEFVELIEAGDSILVVSRDTDVALPETIGLVANARSTSGAQAQQKFAVRLLAAIAGFKPLKVKLNIMDDRTAADLYGGVTAKEFFVTRVRLNNNLQNSENDEDRGASILVFSESLEVAVLYEKNRMVDKDGELLKNNKKWEIVDPKDLEHFAELGNDDPPVSHHVDPRCRGFLTYRPYMYDLMLNSVDRRDERSRRSKILRTLQSVGTLASVVTSVAVPGPQSDIPLAIEKYSSLFIPGFEKIWPTLRETHRQNLIAHTMKTIEEIPYGSDLARVLFFPKREFRGMLGDFQTRISTICPYHFEIEVAILKKDDVQTVQGGTP